MNSPTSRACPSRYSAKRTSTRSPGRPFPARGRASRNHLRARPRRGRVPHGLRPAPARQALTNIVKNAVEAIERRRNRGEHSLAGDRVDLSSTARRASGHRRARYRRRPARGPRATDRAIYDDAGAGTGLGLAIVKKIVEEHMGEIAFLDRPAAARTCASRSIRQARGLSATA